MKKEDILLMLCMAGIFEQEFKVELLTDKELNEAQKLLISDLFSEPVIDIGSMTEEQRTEANMFVKALVYKQMGLYKQCLNGIIQTVKEVN